MLQQNSNALIWVTPELQIKDFDEVFYSHNLFRNY
jgi:hypothetical protein